MKTTLKETSSCEKVLSVTVSSEWIQEEYADFFQKIAPRAKVPGFRPGKVPREMLESHFRSEAREQVLEKLISRSFREAVNEKQIEFLGRPSIRQVEFTDQKLNYEAYLEVPPVIKLGKYKGLAVEKKPVEMKPEEVDEALHRVQESLAKFTAVEGKPAEMGQYLIADYTCTVGGKEVEKRNDDWFELREDEFLKGFSQQLVGIQTGEEREVRLTFPENFGQKEWAGKEGVFKVKAKEVKAKQLPALDDELAKETGEFQTLAELKDRLEKQIQAKKARDVETEYERSLFDALLKENTFEVPKGTVERRTLALVENALQSFAQKNTPQEMLEKQAKSLYERFKPEAERQVRISFLLDAVAKKEKLQLADSDFETRYQEAALQHRQAPEAVKKYYEEHPEAKESLEMQILHEKAVQLVKDHVKT